MIKLEVNLHSVECRKFSMFNIINITSDFKIIMTVTLLSYGCFNTSSFDASCFKTIVLLNEHQWQCEYYVNCFWILCCVEGMTEEEILANAILFIAAGYETTSTALSFLLYYLTVNSDCQERLYQEVTKTIGKQVNTDTHC